MSELNKVDIYAALNKPNLLLGCDRELLLMTGVICFALVFTGFSILTMSFGIILFFVASFFYRMMAKADPLMRLIFTRQLKYKRFYPARSSPFAKD